MQNFSLYNTTDSIYGYTVYMREIQVKFERNFFKNLRNFKVSEKYLRNSEFEGKVKKIPDKVEEVMESCCKFGKNWRRICAIIERTLKKIEAWRK